MLDTFFTLLIVLILACLLFYLIDYLVCYKKYKSDSYITFLNDKCNIDIQEDIKKYYLDFQTKENIIENIRYSVTSCLIHAVFLRVITRIEAVQCATGNRLKGYLVLNYYCQPEVDGFQFILKGGNGVLAKKRIIKKKPFYDWIGDDAKRYFRKRDSMKSVTLSDSEELKIIDAFFELKAGTLLELDRNHQREKMYSLFSDIINEILLQASETSLQIKKLYFLLDVEEQINNLHDMKKAYLAGKFSKQRNIDFETGFAYYFNSVVKLGEESSLFTTQKALFNEACSLLGDKKMLIEFLELWREANEFVSRNIDLFFRLGYEYELN